MKIKIRKSLMYTPIIAVLMFLYVLQYRDYNFSLVYFGMRFDIDIRLYLFNMLFTACYCFYIFGDAEKYLDRYGSIIVVRCQSRIYLFRQIIASLIRKILFIEVIKNISFLFASLVINHRIQINFLKYLQEMLIYILTIFFILIIQTCIEMYYTSQIAVTLALSMYILTSFIGSYMYIIYQSQNIKKGLFINLFIITSYGMTARTDAIREVLGIKYFVLLGIITVIDVTFYFIVRNLFKKKDIF